MGIKSSHEKGTTIHLSRLTLNILQLTNEKCCNIFFRVSCLKTFLFTYQFIRQIAKKDKQNLELLKVAGTKVPKELLLVVTHIQTKVRSNFS